MKKRRSVDGNLFQFYENVPYRVKAGVRPLTATGDWASEKGMKDLEYVVCNKYDENYFMKKYVVECSAFYTNKPDGYDRPLSLVFASDDDLEPIILE